MKVFFESFGSFEAVDDICSILPMRDSAYESPRKWNEPTGLIIAGAWITLIGIGFIGSTVPTSRKIHSAQTWVGTSCIVSHRGTALSFGRGHRGQNSARVSYGYEYGGHHYESSSFDFDDGWTIGEIEGRSAFYSLRIDAPAICWVNPENPFEAVIYRGVPREIPEHTTFGTLMAGLGFAFLSSGLLLRWRKKKSVREFYL